MDFRTNRDYLYVQNYLIGFDNSDEVFTARYELFKCI
jgi:hypothetical protein